jgi:hypothetical protein
LVVRSLVVRLVGFGFGVEDLAGLLRGAGEALGDEVEEARDVLEAGGGRGVGAEDAAADLDIHATTAYGDIVARSL